MTEKELTLWEALYELIKIYDEIEKDLNDNNTDDL